MRIKDKNKKALAIYIYKDDLHGNDKENLLSFSKVNKLIECNSEVYLKPCQIFNIDQDGAFSKNWLQLLPINCFHERFILDLLQRF